MIDGLQYIFQFATDILFGIKLTLFDYQFPIIAPLLFVFLLKVVWNMFFSKKEGG